MKVLVADKLEQSGLDGIRALGCEVLLEPDLNGPTLEARLAESEAKILIVRSTKVDRAAIEASTLGLIIRAGAGVNTIDIEAASESGVQVANCPGKNAIAVAELAFGLMLAVDRDIAFCDKEFKEGIWNKKAHSGGRGLYGRTLGLIGLGNIAQEMIPRAKAFGMNIIAFSRWMTPEVAAALNIGRAASLTELAKQAEIVSVHAALSPQTKGMLDAEFFAALRPGTIFINSSRSEVVDEPALIEVLKSGRIAAGLDVFDGEPAGSTGTVSSPLAELPNVVVTHHIGASTEQAQEAVAAETVRIVKEFILTGKAVNTVNVAAGKSGATHLLVVRHKDQVGVLADILAKLREEEINVQEMENVVLRGSRSAIAQISVDKPISAGSLDVLKQLPTVFDAVLMPIDQVK
ncbi:MAG: 3-phosphoglycerate dehydrogenase family protein [Fimbriimonadaceae bacterium]|nr:3-phosphoglycerate dehydrogenase family protein [Fimbriimonadaceae bacterium]